MNAEIRNTEVDLSGLLEVLGKNLYSTPTVAVRELIQNSYDATVRRRLESQWTKQPTIHIYTDRDEDSLIIVDNGAGLTKEEISTYLATIGSGYTRVLRNKQKENNDAVGYFGLGFLTSYVVATNVEFTTTSYQTPHEGWKFTSSGGQTYSLASTPSTNIGTSITLTLREEFKDLQDAEFLRALIRKYCCLLPIDIYINDDESPINDLEIPWKMTNDFDSHIRMTKIRLDFCALFDSEFEPLVTLPISDEYNNVKGILWIQGGGYYGNSDNRNVNVFIRSMFITSECRTLLPEWAGFVGCIIDTTLLTPTASREDLQKDESFFKIQSILRHTLVEGIADVAQNNQEAWRRIVSRHNDALIGAAVSDDYLFDLLHKEIKIPTSEGELYLQEILEQSPDNILRVTLENSGGYEQTINKALGIPVISGFRFAVLPFCRRYCELMDKDFIVLGTKEATSELFPRIEIPSEEEKEYTTYFSDSDTKTIITEFEPSTLPIIRMVDQDALLKKRIEDDKLDKKVSSAALMLARSFTSKLEPEADTYLYLNYSNDIIKNFSTIADTYKSSTASLLKSISQLSDRAHSNNDSIDIFETMTKTIVHLIKDK